MPMVGGFVRSFPFPLRFVFYRRNHSVALFISVRQLGRPREGNDIINRRHLRLATFSTTYEQRSSIDIIRCRR